MANRGRPSVNKRKKEEARKERLKLKEVRRQERHAEKESRPQGGGDEDPDIAGIVPGPQKLPEEWGVGDGDDAGDDEESESA